jgi:two-component system, chemotaxis family, sensor kinase CheA
MSEDDFLKSLQETFAVEAAEHLQAISNGLLAVERSTGEEAQRSLVETIYRHAHSLKGAARAVNFTDIEAVCQPMEDVLASWKRGELSLTPRALDTVHHALDAISKRLRTGDESATTLRAELSSHVQELRKLKSDTATDVDERVTSSRRQTPPPSTRTERIVPYDTVRISITRLEGCLFKAEEMLAAKLASAQQASELRLLSSELNQWKKEWQKVQPAWSVVRQQTTPTSDGTTENLDLSNLATFLEWNQNYFKSLESKIETLARASRRSESTVAKLVDDLLEDSKKLLMLPVATLGRLLAKLVRDLCREQGKEAEFLMFGEEVEIDKRVLDEIKDPLIHIVRNCVDHGIETPAERVRLKKPRHATISLSVSPVNGNKVVIAVSDDGAGVNEQKVRDTAIARGLITQPDADDMTVSELQNLIFQPDLSTSAIITELSGRGIGLAIVREVTERLGGRVEVEAMRNVGSTISMTIPIALATFRGILIEVAERIFVVPTAQVERVARFAAADVKTVEGRETIVVQDRPTSLVQLSEVLELAPTTSKQQSFFTALVLGMNDQRMAFQVDAIVDEQEVLVKQFGKPLVRVRNISGATVLASGRVAPVLNVSDLLKSARRTAGVSSRAAPVAEESEAKSILVAEDSITSRMLLKGILESAGYTVTTAVDGMDAFTKLRSQSFDLLVSDVEMPRLNGFDLAARIRGDNKLSELPIILVTALEKREDRERGIDVGANAYLVKSSFDQSNLLEAVRRLT